MNRRLGGLAAFGVVAALFAAFEAMSLAAARVAATQTRPITFTKQIAPLLYEHCSTCHHPAGPAPFSLLTYSAVRQRAKQIAAVTKSRFMPPWKSEPGYGEFIGQRMLTDTEIDLIQRWVNAGAIEGDPHDLPALPHRPEGWQLGKPDLIVSPPEPYLLRADGTDAFYVFVIPIPTTIARYVKGVEFRPHNAPVTHHANILLDRTPTSRERYKQDPTLGEQGLLAATAEYPPGHFLGWAPGQPDALLPRLSWRLEPGTDLVVSLHMKPSGKPEVVQFSVGFFFSPVPAERTPALIRLGRQRIDIAPGEKTHTITDSYALPVDVEVLALKPHAHYRAHEIKAFATLPDGTKKWLLYIKDWDFQWQHMYRYVAPLKLPSGTTLTLQMSYDNSAESPRNPQIPPQRVRWGPSSLDEMGDLWVQLLTRDDRDLTSLNRDFRRKWAAEDIVGNEGLLETNPGNIALHNDVALLYLELGQTEKAIAHFDEIVRLKPDSADAHFNLGTTLMQAGRFEEAIAQYQEALRIKPDSAAAHNNLGNVLDRQGKLDEAIAEYREVLRLQPNYSKAHNNLGFTLVKRGRAEEALGHFREALRLEPQLPDAHYNLALALQNRGEWREAVTQFREALELRADWAPVLADLAWVLATGADDRLRDGREAVRLAERAVNLTGRRDPEALDVLAAAYAETSQFDRALEAVQQAIQLGPSQPLAARMIERQELYRKRLPFRQR